MSERRPTQPRRSLFQRACLGLLSLFGWRAVYEPLPGPRGIIVLYPHTSNWDFIWGVLYRYGYDLQAHWMAKHTAFRWPLGLLFRSMGGIPVDRRQAGGTIQATVGEFRCRDRLWIAITPEGTRSHTDHWKSGFYRIALAAGVPCALSYIDYGTRTLGIDTYVTFSGNEEEDLARLRDFYADKTGKRPEGAGCIEFNR